VVRLGEGRFLGGAGQKCLLDRIWRQFIQTGKGDRILNFADKDLHEFTSLLASKAAVPGGGGASALVGAVGVALGSMVGYLTVGKPRYAAVEEEVIGLIEKAEALRLELLFLIDADAKAFEPLARAYGIPKDDPARPEIMEAALKLACSTPLDIMRTLGEAIEIHARIGEIGSVLALSDVGVGVVCCKAALQGASLNLFINISSMCDDEYAASLEKEADGLLEKYCALADETYKNLVERLRG
jgi:methenyltetrahydrofolate cyclohydrolase